MFFITSNFGNDKPPINLEHVLSFIKENRGTSGGLLENGYPEDTFAIAFSIISHGRVILWVYGTQYDRDMEYEHIKSMVERMTMAQVIRGEIVTEMNR